MQSAMDKDMRDLDFKLEEGSITNREYVQQKRVVAAKYSPDA